jgi:hypothetical protein
MYEGYVVFETLPPERKSPLCAGANELVHGAGRRIVFSARGLVTLTLVTAPSSFLHIRRPLSSSDKGSRTGAVVHPRPSSRARCCMRCKEGLARRPSRGHDRHKETRGSAIRVLVFSRACIRATAFDKSRTDLTALLAIAQDTQSLLDIVELSMSSAS